MAVKRIAKIEESKEKKTGPGMLAGGFGVLRGWDGGGRIVLTKAALSAAGVLAAVDRPWLSVGRDGGIGVIGRKCLLWVGRVRSEWSDTFSRLIGEGSGIGGFQIHKDAVGVIVKAISKDTLFGGRTEGVEIQGTGENRKAVYTDGRRQGSVDIKVREIDDSEDIRQYVCKGMEKGITVNLKRLAALIKAADSIGCNGDDGTVDILIKDNVLYVKTISNRTGQEIFGVMSTYTEEK